MCIPVCMHGHILVCACLSVCMPVCAHACMYLMGSWVVKQLELKSLPETQRSTYRNIFCSAIALTMLIQITVGKCNGPSENEKYDLMAWTPFGKKMM